MTEGLAAMYAGVVYEEFCEKVIRAVDDKIVTGDHFCDVFAVYVFVICDDFNVGIECLDGLCGGLHLRLAHVIGGVDYLPLQV